MPLFTKKGPKFGRTDSELAANSSSTAAGTNTYNDHNNTSANGKTNTMNGTNANSRIDPYIPKPQLIFHCQLAHGSPTGLITGFASVRELYKKIAECYDIPVEEILFCTLNSHKVDMTKLLGGQIGLDDFIFAHRKGRPKEIEIIKSEDALGLTITDNGAGYAFIKRIKEGSVIDRIEHIGVGDHIEKLNEVTMVGKRHYEVARLLKDIPTGTTFTLRLVEPMKSGFQGIGPRTQSRAPSGRGYGSGKETLRFKANGNVEIEDKFDESTQSGIEAINNLLESFMGINDTELATQIWDLGANKSNSMDFAEAIDNSDLESFGFTDDFIIELWGAITDARRRKTAKN
ncbi:PDZ domain-containing protein GIPC3-like [Rhagoletis pomonella]|uniref:PDZ domain-containing protein GIPC3-like n=1 Tax=Rhagoletis pomonella TaxID=28610 RepID=UPI00178496CB|nr:PDZ domain-containing protein GIPC3-like [Rhagoletis pomonella]XP_036331918.1 PDZ domain-containing protein GIPC3-like [Rhagoletis pomonella]XP_036331919.1 PDZ domain-containing protein GIPC3-like [Rhagoletis pomonella]XP_036331920.1 PDZ domain-containing protein GIPC3-like [Rhagoletis pomonella]XP_036331921.1 PDZ domain-containing protein GIPC3-like [Rhagoletis pomonella]